MSFARLHRWLAIVLVVFLVVWSITGLVFHIKPGWDVAYDQLVAERHDSALPADELAAITSLRAGAEHAAITRVELFDTALGPIYRVTTAVGSELFNATTGQRRSPLSSNDAKALVLDAITRSAHRAAYGDVAEISIDERVAKLRMTAGAAVEIGRHDLRISQRSATTDRIDWLYRIHYLQLTGHRAIDRVLAVLGLALIWAVMIPGIVLFVRRRRQR